MNYRHGDVIIKTGKIRGKRLDHLTLAEGEVTGHSHRVKGDAELYEHEGTLFLRANDECQVVHEEHNTITLPKGDYEINIQREYEPKGWRYVSD